ncbi:MAG: hypothetical protein KBF83_15685 [Pyrinomonadaceae bacterium]|nr:hypothetical protein [Pyrinomonadaceae bacterium]MBP9110995.1 hypothetical protein [Pyrinomonadaceae bacterium]
MQQFSENSLTKDEIYARVETIAREELHAKIPFDWNFCWHDAVSVGNFFTRPDGTDLCELLYRIESEFGILISDEEAEKQKTVRATVDSIYNKLIAKGLS